MYEPGSPSSPFTTTTFSRAGRAAREAPTWRRPGSRRRRGRAGSPPSRLEPALGCQLRERAPEPREVAGTEQHGLGEDARTSGSARRPGRPGEHALDRARAGVDDVAVADGRPQWQNPRQTVSPSEQRAVGEQLAEPQAERRLELGDVRAEVGRPARRPRAGADVPGAARLGQVVVEGRDAVDGRLREARSARPHAARSSSVTSPCSSTASAAGRARVGGTVAPAVARGARSGCARSTGHASGRRLRYTNQ